MYETHENILFDYVYFHVGIEGVGSRTLGSTIAPGLANGSFEDRAWFGERAVRRRRLVWRTARSKVAPGLANGSFDNCGLVFRTSRSLGNFRVERLVRPSRVFCRTCPSPFAPASCEQLVRNSRGSLSNCFFEARGAQIRTKYSKLAGVWIRPVASELADSLETYNH